LHLLVNAAGVVGDEPAWESDTVCGYAHNGFNQCDAVTGCTGSHVGGVAGAKAEFGKGHGGVDGVAPLGGACDETNMERKRLQAEACMVADKPPPSNPMQPFTMRLSPRILQWIDAQREDEESRSSVVRRALIAAMKREQELESEAGCAE